MAKNLTGQQLKVDYFNDENYNFDEGQIRLLDYYADHYQEIIDKFSANLGAN
ncbi:MAG: hypothetical protein MJ219_02895 [Mycoplasmoidaceae bacterium]|nr:hypothetical protein [Mycoplasmoidaceae bacterium]